MTWQWNTGCNRKFVRAMKESWIAVDLFKIHCFFDTIEKHSYILKQAHEGWKLYRMRKQNKNLMKQNQQALFLMDEFSVMFQPPRHPQAFGGAWPVARNFAAISSALSISSPRLASTMALFSSACLWTSATLFLIFSAYSAFFFCIFSCK